MFAIQNKYNEERTDLEPRLDRRPAWRCQHHPNKSERLKQNIEDHSINFTLVS